MLYVSCGSVVLSFGLKMNKTSILRRATHYKSLGVDRSANSQEIKQAYLQKCKELHPDKNKGNKDMHKKFVEVNEAYQALSDSLKRAQYDQRLHTDVQHPSRSTHNCYKTTEFYHTTDQFSSSTSHKHNEHKVKVTIPLTFISVFCLIYTSVLYMVYKRRQVYDHTKSDYYYQGHSHGHSFISSPIYELLNQKRSKTPQEDENDHT